MRFSNSITQDGLEAGKSNLNIGLLASLIVRAEAGLAQSLSTKESGNVVPETES